MQIIKKIFKCFLALIIAIIIIYPYTVKEIVIFSEASSNKKFLAQVVITTSDLNLSVNSHLIVRTQDTMKIIKQYPLLMARDAIQDITLAVHSLTWENEIIKVDIESYHYSGPKQFSVN